MLQPRDLVLQRMVLALRPSRSPCSASFAARSRPPGERFANQRNKFGRSIRSSKSPKEDAILGLNVLFNPFGLPLRPEICPGY